LSRQDVSLSEAYHQDCRLFTGYSPCVHGGRCPGCEHYQRGAPQLLLINLDALGDVLRTTAQLPALHRRWPDAVVTWLTRARAVPLLQGHPLIDRVVALDLDATVELRARRFDLILSVDKGAVGAGLAQQLSAARKLGFGLAADGSILPFNPGARYLYDSGLSDQLKFRDNQRSEPDMLAEALELPYQREPYRLHLSQQERAGPPRAVGFNTGSSPGWPRKRLALELQVAAIRRVAEATGEPVLLLGGPEDSQRNEELASRLGPLAEPTPTDLGLRSGAAQVARCQVVVSGDSLGMHLAIALGCHVVAWFGPTCPQEIDLYDRGVKLLASVCCAPCWQAGCQREPACNGELDPDLVVTAVLDCLVARREGRVLDELRGGSWAPRIRRRDDVR